jgi:hypothetical protein
VLCVHVVFCGTLFVPLEFLFLAIVLSVLRFMDSDYMTFVEHLSLNNIYLIYMNVDKSLIKT